MGDQRRDDGTTIRATTRRRRQASTLSASFPRRAGAYLLGPRLNSVSTSPVRSIVQHLAKKEGTDEFYTMKILELEPPPPVQTTQDDRQGRMLVHTEYSLLSLLAAQEGVIHCHDLFVDKYDGGNGERARLCLVLDCVTPHDFARDTETLINLQHYVIRERKVGEDESLVIFRNIIKTIRDIHERNVVHRDLKLGNIVLHEETKDVIITNFCLGIHLIRPNDLLVDQRGSPAYISPDVLSEKPYSGKASDMWALGVVLYTMLYGIFPFYHNVPAELFSKIKAVDYTIPTNVPVSEETIDVIRNLLKGDQNQRYTAQQALDSVEKIIADRKWLRIAGGEDDGQEDQVVPCVLLEDESDDVDPSEDDDDEDDEPTPSPPHKIHRLASFADSKAAEEEDKEEEEAPSSVQILITKSNPIPMRTYKRDTRPPTDKEKELLMRLCHNS